MSDAVRERLQSSLSAAYSLDRELGGGGMSRVFVAREVALGRDVVVKVLAPELAEGISAERFAREVRLAARLQHPNVVPMLAAGNAGGLPYYTMPFVRGESLRARIERARTEGAPVPLGEATSILRDVARALAYAHAEGVVHRDVKPENVLLSRGAASVSDFGIAKAIAAAGGGQLGGSDASTARNPTELTVAGAAIGTPAYMAPEQAVGEMVDDRTDIYAWGVMAYELLAGEHPFAGHASASGMIAAHLTETPAPLASRRGGLPTALVEVVTRSLEKERERRPADAGALLAALERGAQDAPPLVQRATRRMIAVGAAAAIALLVAAGVFAWRARPDRATFDPQLLAVLPFRVTGSDSSLRYLREGMLDLVAAKLTGVPRTVDQRSVLAAWRREGGSEGTDLDEARALRVARALGAGRILQGDIASGGDRVLFTASLLAAPSGDQRARATVSGAAAALPLLVDSLIAKLLALDAGEGVQRAATIADRPLPALQQFLEGQAQYREGRYRLASDAYDRALQFDSTFALAGLMLWKSAGWTFDQRGPRGRAIAVAYRAQLSPRDRLMLINIYPDSAPTNCADDIAERERAVALAPDMPEIWYEVGDRWVHCGAAMLGQQEASRRAVAAFERALALDSTFSPAYEHLVESYFMLGDSVGTVAAHRRSADSTREYFHVRELLFSPDVRARRSAYDALRTTDRDNAIYSGFLAMLLGASAELAVPMLRAGSGRGVTAPEIAREANIGRIARLNGGRPREALGYAARVPEYPSGRLFEATFWDGDSAAAAAALPAAVRRLDAAPPSDALAFTEWSVALFDLAQYELAHGETAHVRPVLARLRAAPRIAGAPTASLHPARMALVLDAQLAALGHRADAAARLAALDSMLAMGPYGARAAMAGNLVAARLWERSGDVERAYAAAKRWAIAPGLYDMLLYSTYLREQGRLAARLGRTEEAIRAYRHYLAMRPDPEAPLRAADASVRAELRRLERAGAGR